MPGPVVFLLKGYPRLSETFIAQEILALERCGLDIRIASLRHPTDKVQHALHEQIAAPVSYLPEYLRQEPGRVLKAWWRARRRATYRACFRAFLKDFRRDRTINRVRRFGQALVLAHELDSNVVALHAHFLHTPASVARYASILTGKPWSVSAHAKDIWTTPEWEKREKLHECDWLTTCNDAAYQHLRALVPPGRDDDCISLLYHGIDLDRFQPVAHEASCRDGDDAADPVQILSVGRAVPKKGYDDLIDALALLPDHLHWQFTHIGGGPALDDLVVQAKRRGVAERITWRGAQTQDAVLAAYRAADLFVLASRINRDGDRDGLPNVLLEAQSQGLAVVATDVAGIPELVLDGKTGLLVPERCPQDMADALQRLIGDPSLQQRLGEAGQARVISQFSQARWIGRLAARFGLNDGADDGAERAAAQ